MDQVSGVSRQDQAHGGGQTFNHGAARSFIVVGAGTAGCIVARRLVEAGHTVTVYEAGPYDDNPAIHQISRLGELWHSAEDWDYFTVPQEHSNGRVIHWPRGRVTGGSHALNAAIWVRGAAEDYDSWAKDGCSGWSWMDVEPWFKALEDFVPGDDHAIAATRGQGGPIPVRQDYPLNPVFKSIIQAAGEVGVAYNPDYNSGELDGISQQQINVRAGRRFNTWMAMLKSIADHPRLRVVTGAVIQRLVWDGNNAVGVQFAPLDTPDAEGTVDRADEVILCAGAIDTPKILLRSGVGPAHDLKSLGIPVVADLPVGENLHDHLLAPVIAETTGREIPHPDTDWSVTQTHLFWRSEPDLPLPDTQPIHFSVPMYDDGMEGPADGFTLHAGLVRPYSRGTLKLTGARVTDPVELDPNIFSDSRDLDALHASLRQARAMVAAPALAADWGAVEIYPGAEVQSAESEREYIKRWVTTYHHQVGTCRMGTEDQAVVDPQTLNVWGLRGVRVMDASVMPTVPTGNTNASTAMIAAKGVAALLAESSVGAEVPGVGLENGEGNPL
ncbi:GMC family oxidoreductase [Kocuria sp.]|uniref:GMC family oxidoreductase n=1 Tax=Kocuria sp. TaxID=1871328 RepID=UPI0026DED425|nr:GMC family oxidoreductase [Kocuria sp.]MDO5619166.1 GMC family oxidoreductase [Kocuria sp.]